MEKKAGTAEATEHKQKVIGVRGQKTGRKRRVQAGKELKWTGGRLAVLAVAVVVVVGLVIWGIVVLVLSLTGVSEDTEYVLGSDDAAVVQETAQGVWRDAVRGEDTTLGDDVESGVAAVKEYFSGEIAKAESETEKVNLVLVEMAVFAANAQPEAVKSASARVSMAEMDEIQLGQYYGMLMNAYYNLGDFESGNYFAQKLGEMELDEEAGE